MKNKIRNRDGRGRFSSATKPETEDTEQWEKIVKAAKNGFCGLAGKLAEDYGFETKHLLDAFDKNAHGLSRLDLAQILERRTVYIHKQREKIANSEIETPKTEKVEKAEKKMKNLTPHILNFTDGSILEPSGFVATIEWRDDFTHRQGLTLVSRDPFISRQESKRIEEFLDGDFGIVSFPVVSAARGTMLETLVGSVIMKSRTEKIAFPDRFAI